MSGELEWSFFGRVLPERVPVNLQMIGVEMDEGVLDLHIHLSQITVVLRAPKTWNDHFTVRNILDAFIRSVLDLIGYYRGISFDVDFISCVNSLGQRWTFGAEVPVLFHKKQSPPSSISDGDFNLFLADPAAMVALSDFREAMRVPMQTGFFCYRAVEAMMQAEKAKPEDKDGPAWESIRAALHLEKSALEFIKGYADWARHGRTGEVSDSDRAKLFVLTDEIIARYLRYIAGGRVPLSAAENPLLFRPT